MVVTRRSREYIFSVYPLVGSSKTKESDCSPLWPMLYSDQLNCHQVYLRRVSRADSSAKAQSIAEAPRNRSECD